MHHAPFHQPPAALSRQARASRAKESRLGILRFLIGLDAQLVLAIPNAPADRARDIGVPAVNACLSRVCLPNSTETETVGSWQLCSGEVEQEGKYARKGGSEVWRSPASKARVAEEEETRRTT